MNKTGIVVLGWNRADITENFFNYLMQNTKPEDFRLVFIDNGSEDGTPQILKQAARFTEFNFHFITNPINLGVPKGWNQGIRELLGYGDVEHIVVLNNDVEFYSNQWLDALIDPLRSNPKLIVGTEFVNINSVAVVDGKMRTYLNGWCLAFHRNAVHDIGYFNEEFSPCFYEDVEFSFRAKANGYELKQVNAPIFHLSGKTHSTSNLNIDSIHHKNKPTFDSVVRRYDHPQEIVFYCNAQNHRFRDGDFEGVGVGGAEAALICLTREFARSGYNVTVVNQGPDEVINSRLQYRNILRYNPAQTDIFIQYRIASTALQQVDAKLKLFWSTDQYTDTGRGWDTDQERVDACARIWAREVFPYIDGFSTISPFHRNFIAENYPVDDFAFDLFFEDLGVNEPDYWVLPEKQALKMLWCTVPHRGLGYLLDMWPDIRGRYPEAELVVTSDYRLWGVPYQDNERYLQGVTQSGINAVWKVPRSELVQHQLTSDIMAYAGSYEENFCISAAECISAGAVPVVSNIGSMKTTVGHAGVVVNTHPITDEHGLFVKDVNYKEAYLNSLFDLVDNKNKMQAARDYGRNKLWSRFSYKQIVKNWQRRFESMMAD